MEIGQAGQRDARTEKALLNRKADLSVPIRDRQEFAGRLKASFVPGTRLEDAAQAIGVSVSGLKKWRSGAADPGVSHLAKIAAFAGVSAGWLATGDQETPADCDAEGRLLLELRRSVAAQPDDAAKHDQLRAIDDLIRLNERLRRLLEAKSRAFDTDMQHLESSDIAAGLRDAPAGYVAADPRMVQIPELDVRAAQGEGGFTLEVLRQNVAEHTRAAYGFPRDGFAQLFGAAPENVVIIEAVGDSNVPEILPGQRVLVDITDRNPSPPGFFALWDGLAVVLKRVEYLMGSDPPTITLISANPAYKPRTVTVGEAHILGRVLGNWVRR